MMLLRPVSVHDHDQLLALAETAGIGMTSLPPDADVLEHKILRSVASFAGCPPYPKGESFLFGLEDTEKGRLVGTAGITSHVGIKRPFYSYKLSTIVQACAKLDIYSLQQVLHMVNDYTGATEIGSLFLCPEYRRDGIGRFLSRSRYMMLSEFPALFSDIVIAEIRGVQDMDGKSPFYQHLAQHFFQMEFQQADYVHATQGGQFITDLMPKYPVYVELLPPEAQAVIGQPLEASKPAKQLLENEGFRYQGYVDVFDAGPTMQVERASIRTVRESRRASIRAFTEAIELPKSIVATTTIGNFSVLWTPLEESGEGVTLTKESAELLKLKVGDTVRYVL